MVVQKAIAYIDESRRPSVDIHIQTHQPTAHLGLEINLRTTSALVTLT
jgi:hypothetical protein